MSSSCESAASLRLLQLDSTMLVFDCINKLVDLCHPWGYCCYPFSLALPSLFPVGHANTAIIPCTNIYLALLQAMLMVCN